jgi:hypothetical protein
MKKTNWIVLFVAPLLLLVFAILFRQKPKTLQDFDIEYTNTVSQWGKKVFVPMKPFASIVSDLSRVKIAGGEILTDEQRQQLTNSILGWFKAYSDGNKESYLAFRFPAGVPWRWKNGSLETMSNYFVNGIVFDSMDLFDAWMRRYGNPDNITNMVAFAESSKDWSEQKRREVRDRWIAKYGDGSSGKMAERPEDPFTQWLTIAHEHSGMNWWLNYWTGVCFDAMVISISTSNTIPTPLHQYPFGQMHHSKGFEANVPFENMGIGRMDRKSYIEWDSTYNSLLQQQGRILMANIYCLFSRATPETPEPALLRLVYFDEFKTWVPFEMDDANPLKALQHTLYF